MNKVILIGRVGKDPDVKQISDTFTVAALSLATNKRYKDKDGQKQEKTEWHQIKAFNNVAVLFQNYVKKGDLIAVEGEIETRTWEKNGENRYSTEIIVNNLEFLSGQSREELSDQGDEEIPSDDLPF